MIVYTQGQSLTLIDEALPPPPPPPSLTPTVRLQSFTGVGDNLPVLAFWRWCTYERYDRMQSLVTLPATGGQLRMIAVKHYSGESMAVGAVTVTVTLTPINADGSFGAPIVAAPYTPSPTASSINVPMPTLPAGKWYRLTAVAGSWQVPAWYAYVPGGALPAFMPVVRANWEMMHLPVGNTYTAADAVVPAVFNPTTQPYPARVFENTTATPSRAACVETQLVIGRAVDGYRPAKASATTRAPEGGAYSAWPAGVDGLTTSFNRQAYFYGDLIGDIGPMLPLADGPRGRGAVFAPQHLQMGRNGKVIFTDNWRLGRIDPDGTVHTMVGHHVPVGTTPTLWTDSPRNFALAGDWSAVTGALGLRECWGVAIDLRTVASDPAGVPINGELPHIGLGPVMYLPDRWHNRILRVQFNGGGDAAFALFGNRDRDAPAKVTEWKTVSEPWDCVTDGGNQLIVSERGASRIAVYNLDTGALVTSWPMPAATPSPEGLYFQDGVVYYACVKTEADGHVSAGAIRKRVLATGVDTLFKTLTTPWIIDDNSRFAKIAVSDGTFGPRGMVGLATWSGNGYGYPLLFTPAGAQVAGSVFPGQPEGGPGLYWKGVGYPSAVGFGLGRMVVGGAQEGVRVISKAQPTDANVTAGYLAGRSDYYARGYKLTNGDDGFGYYGVALPWGVSANIDEYLTKHGHVRT